MMRWIETIANSWWPWMFHSSWQLAILVVVIAISTRLLRRHSALLLHSLWLIVLAKALVPPFIRLPAESVPWLASVMPTSIAADATGVYRSSSEAIQAVGGLGDLAAGKSTGTISPLVILLACWIAGVMVFWLMISRGHWKLTQSLRDLEPLDEGPLRIAYEKIAFYLGIERCPDLKVTDRWTSPFLVGVMKPNVVMPESITRTASEQDITVVMAHELLHYRRRDIWIGWLQVIALSAFWFHPLFWWAMRQLRQSREEACDESVLRQTSIAPEDYGDVMLRWVTKSQSKSLAGLGLVGVFERSTQTQIRLEKIMTFEKSKRAFGKGSKVVLGLVGLALLPVVLIQRGEAQDRAGAPTKAETQAEAPLIVSSVPAIGATDVALSTNEIRVTFDQDMSGGMSWTGGPPLFPPAVEGVNAHWIDKRTCVLPVKLQRGTFYRVGINSTSFSNFKSANGEAAYPTAIYFATVGASPEVVAQANTPEIVRLEPANQATDVDANLDTLSVTFNMPMGEGMSWIGGGSDFPAIPDGKRPVWSADKRTCTFPVKLDSGKTYRLGLNSQRHRNFQSAGGVPLQPVKYSFQTQ